MAHLSLLTIKFCAVVLTIFHTTAAEICRSKICEFHFHIRHGRTMTYLWRGQTYNVLLNGTGLVPETPDRFKRPLPDSIPLEDVITADGFQRNVLTVNGQLPGPAIEVTEGAEVVVHVTNYLLTQGVSIHWHGMHQKGTPWMDGVSHVSQCPIFPGLSFTYRFHADPVGTHWYHDHNTNLRADGLYGLFVVHPREQSQMLPLPERHLLLSDWYHVEAHTLEITNFGYLNGAGNHIAFLYNREYGPDNVFLSPYFFVSALINGRGHLPNNNAPLETFAVKSGDTYRFRMLNAASKYGFEISIDGHKLNVVALDGHEIQPITVDSIMLQPGERIDFMVAADRPIGAYWMRSLILRLGTGHHPSEDNVEKGTYATLRYDGASASQPTTSRRECTTQNECVIFNCPFKRFANGVPKRCIQTDEARSATPQHILNGEYGLNGPPDLEIFLNMGFHAAAGVNGRRFIHPTLPFSDPNFREGIVSCDRPDCNEPDSGCACTHIISLPYNKTVQFVMANYRPGKAVTHHGMHLHGHDFAVLKIGLPAINRTMGYTDDHMYNPDLECVNSFCKDVRWNVEPNLNLDRPAVRDTINVAARGYTVVRFRTTNPGAWFFHCHITNHVLEGMAMIFDEARDRQPKPPKNFPRCPSFKWTESDFERYVATKGQVEAEDDEENRPLSDSDLERQNNEIDSRNKNERNNCTPKEPKKPVKNKEKNQNTVDSEYLAKHVVISNANFIGLIFGCVALGAALVLLAAILVSRGSSNNIIEVAK